MTDGPYTEGHEHIGGLTVIKVEDLDAALEWGRKSAQVIAGLAIEVRPFRRLTVEARVSRRARARRGRPGPRLR